MVTTLNKRPRRKTAGPTSSKRALITGAMEATKLSDLIEQVQAGFGVSQESLVRLTGFSRRSITAWKTGKLSAEPAVRRFQELQRLLLSLDRVMKADFIPKWLHTPNEAFDGLKPLEVIERGQIDRIWRMIFYVESGMPT